jgi:hypothetical protein
MSIDYLPDEMRANIDARPFEGDEFTVGFSVGWRAACEAKAAKAQAKAGPEPCKECNGTKRMWPGNPVSPLCNACRPRRVCDGPAPSPQPATDWRAACVVRQCDDGGWDVESPTTGYFIAADRWYSYDAFDQGPGEVGIFQTDAEARAALAACTTPPPDWRQP